MSQYADADGFAEVAEAPTGFMVIKRHVFYKMMQHYPELNYVPDGPKPHPQAHLHWLFFDCMVDPDFAPLPVRGLRFLPALARHGRQGLCRPQLEAAARRPTPLPRRLDREPEAAGPLVRACDALRRSLSYAKNGRKSGS